MEEFLTELYKLGLDFRGLRSFEGIFSYLYVVWNICKDYPEIKNIDLPNPYEHLKKLIERTTSIYQLEGQFHIDDITFNNLDKYSKFRLPSTDDDFLNYIDNRKKGYGFDIPNQKETDKLWEEFQKLKQNG